MLSQKLLAEITIPLAEFPSVNENQDLQDVVNTFLNSNGGPPSGGLKQQEVVVLDSDNVLIGITSIKDVLKALEPKLFESKIDHFEGARSDSSDISTLWEDPFFQRCGKNLTKKVHEVCEPFNVYAKETDSILKVLSMMLSMNKKLIPIRKNNKVIGVVHLGDVFTKVVSCCMTVPPESKQPLGSK